MATAFPVAKSDRSGGLLLQQLADSTAQAGRLYYSTTQGDLVYKDLNGVLNLISHAGVYYVYGFNSAAIQAAIDAAYAAGGGTAMIIGAGTYTLGPGAVTKSNGASACIYLKSNVTLYVGPGVVLKRANGANCYMVTNDNVTATSDVNIGLRGEGSFDPNLANQSGWGNPNWGSTGGAWAGHSVWFGGVQGLKISGITLGGDYSYHILLSQCNNVLVENPTFTAGRDGLHVHGPSNNGRVVGVKFLSTGDDAVAFCVNDYDNTKTSVGSITNWVVEDTYVSGAQKAVRLTGTVGYEISDVKISGVTGDVVAQTVGVRIADEGANLTGCLYKRIVVEGVHLSQTGTASVAVLLQAIGLKSITVRDVDGWSNVQLLQIGQGTVIDSLTLNDIRHSCATQTTNVITVYGQVRRLNGNNWDFDLDPARNGYGVAIMAGGMIQKASITNYHQRGGVSALSYNSGWPTTYSTGTITVSGSTVTLTGGTWPWWASFGKLTIGGNNEVVKSCDSNTQLTMELPTLNGSSGAYTLDPGVDEITLVGGSLTNTKNVNVSGGKHRVAFEGTNLDPYGAGGVCYVDGATSYLAILGSGCTFGQRVGMHYTNGLACTNGGTASVNNPSFPVDLGTLVNASSIVPERFWNVCINTGAAPTGMATATEGPCIFNSSSVWVANGR